VLQLRQDLLNRFPGLLNPVKYSSSRSYRHSKAAPPNKHVWPARMPLNIAIATWCYGHTLEAPPTTEGPSEPHIKPPRPPEVSREDYPWELREDPSCKGKCTLITKKTCEENVRVYMYRNKSTGETITIGPSSGIYMPSHGTKGYAYDAEYVYELLPGLLQKHSTLELEYEMLKERVATSNKYYGRHPKLPSQQQFYNHFHQFRNSLVTYVSECVLFAGDVHTLLCMCTCCTCTHARLYMHTYIHNM